MDNNIFYPVIWKEQVVLFVGAASSRDHLISRLEAAPTGGFCGNSDFPDKRLIFNQPGILRPACRALTAPESEDGWCPAPRIQNIGNPKTISHACPVEFY